MHSSPVSLGKRPEYKQSRSGGWDWPRLVPIHEQQSRSSQASQSSAPPSLRDHSEQEEPPTTVMSTRTSTLPVEEDAPLPRADSNLAAWRSVAETIEHQPYKSPRQSLPSLTDSEKGERRAAGLGSQSVEDVAERNDPGSGHESVEDVAGTKITGSEYDSLDDFVKRRASASKRGPIKDIAQQDDIEIPVGYETIVDVPLKEEVPVTPPSTPIPPVMDRISIRSNSIPKYTTPKIMVHKPSQSVEAENATSLTIDEIRANENQSMPQEDNPQPLHSTQDSNLNDAHPMQSMSLTPIAWQAPKDQKVKKRKLYLRKFRNAAARKTILKITLGRQLASPTKQMLRLLANGENITVPEKSGPGVEAATMLVPLEAVGTVTGAVLLPQGVAGAVSDS